MYVYIFTATQETKVSKSCSVQLSHSKSENLDKTMISRKNKTNLTQKDVKKPNFTKRFEKNWEDNYPIQTKYFMEKKLWQNYF